MTLFNPWYTFTLLHILYNFCNGCQNILCPVPSYQSTKVCKPKLENVVEYRKKNDCMVKGSTLRTRHVQFVWPSQFIIQLLARVFKTYLIFTYFINLYVIKLFYWCLKYLYCLTWVCQLQARGMLPLTWSTEFFLGNRMYIMILLWLYYGSTSWWFFCVVTVEGRTKNIRLRTTFTKDQLEVMEKEFAKNDHPDMVVRERISRKLNLTTVQVSVSPGLVKSRSH